VEEFALQLSTIVNDLDILGDPIGEYKAVQKFLCVVPRNFRQMASSIEELTGRLTVMEADEAEDGDSGQQLLPW
jgi:hypothetical protein